MRKLFSKIWKEYRHGFFSLGYLCVYMIWFVYLEKTVTRHYQVIHVALDDYIPFCELFVIPYFLWFGYVAAAVIFFLFRNKSEYYKICSFLFTGMTVFLVVSTLWPNGQHLRPFTMPRDNIFTRMVAGLYRTDTPTNLWPSIHVYNSLGVHIALTHSKEFGSRRKFLLASRILCCSIILSTMFLKQHSCFDVATAFLMAAIVYVPVYRPEKISSALKNRLRSRRKRFV